MYKSGGLIWNIVMDNLLNIKKSLCYEQYYNKNSCIFYQVKAVNLSWQPMYCNLYS